jgi:membrane protease YdiL (CAAX protease family)
VLERSLSLSTKRSFAVFGVYLFAQLLVQALVGIVVGTRLAIETSGTADAEALAAAIQALGGPGACVSGALAGLAVLRMLPASATVSSLDVPADAALARSARSRLEALLWPFAAGVMLAVVYVTAAKLFYPPTADLNAGPFAGMAGSPGVHRALWATFAVCCAPAIEEVVFRGALFTALRRIWGGLSAGFVVTAAFVALHASELGGYPPAMIAVTSLALLALALRVRTGTVAAAIAAHAGYNLAIVINSFLA